MSLNRYNARTDTVQAAIVKGLEQVGVRVWIIKLPCDLLCWVRGTWQTLEVKTIHKGRRKPLKDKRQKAQNDFLRETQTPVVTSLEGALIALSLASHPVTSPTCTSKLTSGPTSSVAGP